MLKGLIIKYDADGDSIWVKKFTQLPQYSHFTKMDIDDSGHVYVVGDYGDTLSDCLVLKYAPEGNLLWYLAYNSPQHYSDVGNCIEMDTNGTIYILSSNHVVPYLFNNTLLKINKSGTMQWTRVFTGILNGEGRCGAPAGIALSTNGNALYYTTPRYNGTSYDIVTLKYNSIGDTEWVRCYAGGLNFDQSASPSDIKPDINGNVYIVGSAYFEGSGIDYVTIKYDSSGYRSWVMNYNGPLANSDDHASDLCLDKYVNLYVSGISSRQNSPIFLWDAATVKYDQPNGIISNSNELPVQFTLSQNYPNPFNPVTKIKFEAPLAPPEGGMQGLSPEYIIFSEKKWLSFYPPLGGGKYGPLTKPNGTAQITPAVCIFISSLLARLLKQGRWC